MFLVLFFFLLDLQFSTSVLLQSVTAQPLFLPCTYSVKVIEAHILLFVGRHQSMFLSILLGPSNPKWKYSGSYYREHNGSRRYEYMYLQVLSSKNRRELRRTPIDNSPSKECPYMYNI